MRNELMSRIRATANSTLAIGGVSSPLDSFVVAASSVLRTNFCAEEPAHRQSAKRYQPFSTPKYEEHYFNIDVILFYHIFSPK
jgi:hypothetical protein